MEKLQKSQFKFNDDPESPLPTPKYNPNDDIHAYRNTIRECHDTIAGQSKQIVHLRYEILKMKTNQDLKNCFMDSL